MNLTTDLKSHQTGMIIAANVVLGAAILASLFFFARTISDAVQKKERRHVSHPITTHMKQTEPGMEAYESVIRNNPFGVPAGSLKAPNGGAEPSSPAMPDIKLAGTISGALKHGYAVLIDSNGMQSMFRTGESVFGKGDLVSVEKNSVLIRTGGKLVKIPMTDLTIRDATEASRIAPNPSGFIRPAGKGEYILDQKALQFALDHPNQIMMDAKLIPNMINNRQEGFVLHSVRDDGLYSRLGMRNGDVLLRINGSDISKPENALQAFMTLKGLDKVQFDMIRDGNKMTLSYLIR